MMYYHIVVVFPLLNFIWLCPNGGCKYMKWGSMFPFIFLIIATTLIKFVLILFIFNYYMYLNSISFI
jgi:hypothetical protein